MIVVHGNVVRDRRRAQAGFRTSDGPPLPPIPTTGDPEVAYGDEGLEVVEGELLELVAPQEVAPALLYLTTAAAVSPGVFQSMTPPEVVVLMTDGSVWRRPIHGRRPWTQDHAIPGTTAFEASPVPGGSGEDLDEREWDEASEETRGTSEDPAEPPASPPSPPGIAPTLYVRPGYTPQALDNSSPFVVGAAEAYLRLSRPVYGIEYRTPEGDTRELGTFADEVRFPKEASQVRLIVSADATVTTAWLAVPDFVRRTVAPNHEEDAP